LAIASIAGIHIDAWESPYRTISLLPFGSPPGHDGTLTSGKSTEHGSVSLSHALLSVRAEVSDDARFAGSLVTFMATEIAAVIGSTAGALTQIFFVLTSWQMYLALAIVAVFPTVGHAPPALLTAAYEGSGIDRRITNKATRAVLFMVNLS
jgi:hypothetical protein